MKSKDLRKLLLSKYGAGQAPKKIFEELNGAVSHRTVKQWCKMIWETGAIDLSKPFGCHRTVLTKAAIQKIKRKSTGGKRISCRRLAFEMDMSFSSACRILRKDLKMKPCKITVELLLKDEHKAQRKKFSIWERKKFQKEDTMRIVFSDEKCLILTVSITVKMIVYGPLIERKQIGEVEKTARKVSAKSNGMVSHMVRGRCAPCSV